METMLAEQVKTSLSAMDMETMLAEQVKTSLLAMDDETCWQAVARREAGADGFFVYSVATTGIYCLPSCPSRRALRAHVRFHPSCEAAEREGFRPCLRCRPKEVSLAERLRALVAHACRILDEAEEEPSLTRLAEWAGLSPGYFQRVFKRIVGLTPKTYVAARRHRRVQYLLAGADSVTEVMYEAGYDSSRRFYEQAAPMLGMKPSRYRNHGEGVGIRYASAACSLGVVLVGVTENGVCALLLGDEEEKLITELGVRFAKAKLVRDEGGLAELLPRIVALVDHPVAESGGLGAIELDVRGTVFQHKVWRFLLDTMQGARITYTELAESIGAPGSARAVAQACAANPVAVLIPCHRVVRRDGSLSGYRWGVERKRALLAREQSGH